MTSKGSTSAPQIAVWYFVGATFIFAAPVLYFPDAELWIRIASFALGFLVMIAGGVRLAREITQRRDSRNAPPGDGGTR